MAGPILVSVFHGPISATEFTEDVTNHAELGKCFRFLSSLGKTWLHLSNARTFEDVAKAKEAEVGSPCCFELKYKWKEIPFSVRIVKPYEMKLKFSPEAFAKLQLPGNLWDEGTLIQLWFHAAAKGDSATLRVLRTVFQGVIGVDIRDDEFRTALMVACYYGHQDAASFLLDEGAELNCVTNNAEDNAFMFSMMRDTPENINLTRWLLSCKEADVHWRNYENGTLLHHAVFFGNIPVVQLLLMEGADPNAKDHNGNDPVAALDVSIEFAPTWMKPEQQWSADKARACAKWLKEEGPKFLQNKLEIGKSKALSEKLLNKKRRIKLMLSYDWDHQREILLIKEKLETGGYEVWMDLQEMSGSILASMADGVETADVVLLAISPRYQQSENCRLEAEYATRRKKKILPLMMEPFEPTSWLGLILGTKLYVQCYNVELTQKLPEVEQQLYRILNEEKPMHTPAAAVPEPAPVSANAKCISYTPQQVAELLKKNDLVEIAKVCEKKGIDGVGLMELRHLYERNPQMFNIVVDKLKIPLEKTLKFGAVLRKLDIL